MILDFPGLCPLPWKVFIVNFAGDQIPSPTLKFTYSS